jgi:hypothetical protein
MQRAASNVNVIKGLHKKFLVKWREHHDEEGDEWIAVNSRMYLLSPLYEDRSFHLRPVGMANMAGSTPFDSHPAFTSVDWHVTPGGPRLIRDMTLQPKYLRLALGIIPDSPPNDPKIGLYRPTDSEPEWCSGSSQSAGEVAIQEEAKQLLLGKIVPPQQYQELEWWRIHVEEWGSAVIARFRYENFDPVGSIPQEPSGEN